VAAADQALVPFPAAGAPDGPPRRVLAALALLYVVQGVPFGLQATALPVILRQGGASLADIGLVGAVALPWLFKPLWAPLIDRYGSRLGWIAALQLAMATIAVVTALLVGDPIDARALIAAVFLLNLAAATQDIAVDGLAVDLIAARGLGWGNAAQVVGYKGGMIIGGGALVWASGRIGYSGAFLAAAGLFVAAGAAARALIGAAAGRSRRSPLAVAAIARQVIAALSGPGAGATIAIVATYKLGETIATTMYRPFLVDAGFSASQIGAWVGTWGMIASALGSLAGGALVGRIGPQRALTIAASMRALGMVAESASVAWPSAPLIVAATCTEHLFGGLLTTAMFAWMMARVDARVAATHFTALAAIEVLGKMPAGWASGYLAGALGYLPTFACATLLALAWAAALPWLARKSIHHLFKSMGSGGT